MSGFAHSDLITAVAVEQIAGCHLVTLRVARVRSREGSTCSDTSNFGRPLSPTYCRKRTHPTVERTETWRTVETNARNMIRSTWLSPQSYARAPKATHADAMLTKTFDPGVVVGITIPFLEPHIVGPLEILALLMASFGHW